MNYKPLEWAFPNTFIKEFSSRQQLSDQANFHLKVLNARRRIYFNANLRQMNRYYLEIKRSWARYLKSADEVGLLKADNEEIIKRLRELDGSNFRSALSECICCWFFTKKLLLRVFPKPAGRGKKTLDLLTIIEEQNSGVEVKAPFRPFKEGVTVGDDTELLKSEISRANSQFDTTMPNILVLVPSLTPRLFDDRIPLTKALIAREVISFEIDIASGKAIGNSKLDYVVDGKFTKPQKSDRSPGYTRISAVVVIEEKVNELTTKIMGRYCFPRYRITHDILIMHNPYAKYPLSDKVFGGYPQLIKANDHMIWTDRAPSK